MDTSKAYIEMCSKAKEIQEQWKKEDGDFVFCPTKKYGNDTERVLVLKWKSFWAYGGESKIGMLDASECPDGDLSETLSLGGIEDMAVWLPRLDQLMEIFQFREKVLWNDYVLTKTSDGYVVGHYYNNDVECYLDEGYCGVTAEQAYLKYIMDRKYNKSWNSEKKEWV